MSRKLKDLFIKEYVCTNCKTGKIEVTCQLFDDCVQLSAKNCDNCNYQFKPPQVYEAMESPRKLKLDANGDPIVKAIHYNSKENQEWVEIPMKP